MWDMRRSESDTSSVGHGSSGTGSGTDVLCGVWGPLEVSGEITVEYRSHF